MSKYPSPAAASSSLVFPERVTISMASIAQAAQEGLLALAVGAGLQVLDVLMDAEVDAACGPRGRHDADRVAYRHGSEAGSVALGGRRVAVRRPRVRAVDGSGEVTINAYQVFTDTEVLGRLAMEKMLARVSTRRYATVGLEPVGHAVDEKSSGTSRSAVSRRFVAMTESALADLLATDLSDLTLAAIMIDGVYFADTLCVVALGIDTTGVKHPLGVVAGSTENTTTVTDLLTGLRERGLNTTRPVLAVLDGAKARAAAVRAVFDHPVIQRCQEHKLRNVKAYVPKRMRSEVEKRMRSAYRAPTVLVGKGLLSELAKELDHTHPSAAASLREGMDETLTVLALGMHPTLKRTLRSTNAIESMIDIGRDHASNVKRWRDQDMALRWCAAGMTEARQQFRRVNGHNHLPGPTRRPGQTPGPGPRQQHLRH